MNGGADGRGARVSVKISIGVLVVVGICAAFPALLAPGAFDQDILSGALPALSPNHPLGTDALGRDVLKLLIAGARSAMVGPICIAAGSIALGIFLGSVAGWFGGIFDWIISRYADVMLSMPTLLLAIAFAGIIGGGYWVSVFVMIILYSPFDIRIVRAAVIQQKNRPYIESALTLRLSAFRILTGHILPNISLVVFVNFFLNIAYGLVSMSSLSYLGLGVAPGDADWGRQLSDGRAILFDNPAAVFASGAAIVIAAVCVNIVGGWLSERNTLS